MTKSYGYIKQYEKEILELKRAGYTRQQIADSLGLTKRQIKDFVRRYNEKECTANAASQ